MNRWIQRTLLLMVLITAAVLRLTGIDWDDYEHHHPDERYITWVATTIEWPENWSTALDPQHSTFNPYFWPEAATTQGILVPQGEQRKFAYGHLPLYLGVAATRLAEKVGPVLAPLLPDSWLLTGDLLNARELTEYWHLTAVARALTALFDVGTVALLFFLGRRLYGPLVGLLAAAFLALNVMHIQLAHFFTFDPYMTFFVVASVYFMVSASANHKGIAALEDEAAATTPPDQTARAISRRTTFYLLLAAACIGLAVGSKFAAVLLFLPLLLTVLQVKDGRRDWQMLLLGGVAFLIFAVTNPFALLDFSCEVITPPLHAGPVEIPALNWGSCFLDNIGTQGAMVRGEITLPFTRQYSGTLPYLYFIEMQLRWGMGIFLGLLSIIGFGWASFIGVRHVVKWVQNYRGQEGFAFRMPTDPSLIVLAWAVPFFFTTGSFFVKFMRYLQPVTPFLMLYGAAMLWQWRSVVWRQLVVVVTVAVTGLYALSFVNLYQQPHPWAAASEWIYQNAGAQSLILSEQWDDALPINMSLDGKRRRRTEFKGAQLNWLTKTREEDNETKLAANLSLLAKADYLTLTSNRVYGVVPRLPDVYPVSHVYHQLLFDGSLGYEVVAVYGRFPTLFGLHLKPDTFGWPGLTPPAAVEAYLSSVSGPNMGRADESFTVYDQPLTIIFKNSAGMSASEMLPLFPVE